MGREKWKKKRLDKRKEIGRKLRTNMRDTKKYDITRKG